MAASEPSFVFVALGREGMFGPIIEMLLSQVIKNAHFEPEPEPDTEVVQTRTRRGDRTLITLRPAASEIFLAQWFRLTSKFVPKYWSAKYCARYNNGSPRVTLKVEEMVKV